MTSEVIATPPSVSWAQTSSLVYLTINVECEKPEIKFDKTKAYFKGTCAPDQKLHEVEISLYSEIDSDKCSYTNKGRYIDIVLTKLKSDEPFWPSLTSDRKKHHWLKVDFARWQDEDESGDEMNDLFSDKMPDFGDENGKDESSSEEDEELPGLE